MKANIKVKTLMFSIPLLLIGCNSMKGVENPKTLYMCEYPSMSDTMPVATVKIVEYTQTGLLEAYVRSNAQVDKANAKLLSIQDFINRAKAIEAEHNKE